MLARYMMYYGRLIGIVCALSNGTISSDLERRQTIPFSTFCIACHVFLSVEPSAFIGIIVDVRHVGATLQCRPFLDVLLISQGAKFRKFHIVSIKSVK